jgi:hypothetical protein
MIKVLEKPKKPPKQIRCHDCKALLSFEVEDLYGAYFESDWTESGPEGVGIDCPECGEQLYWKAARIVEEVWMKKRTKKEKDK